MKPIHTDVTDVITSIWFDVTDSSALSLLSISDCDWPSGRKVNVHIIYKSNPEARYLYGFHGLEAIANLYLTLMGEESAGKFATYVRNNADDVYRNADGKCEFLPARKTLQGATS